MTQASAAKPNSKVRISKKPHAPRPARRRISRACDRCKVKKTRCDGHEPCEKCREADSLCSFTIKRSRDSRNYYLRMHNIYEDAVQQLFSMCRDHGSFPNVLPFDDKNCDAIRTSQIFEALGLVRPDDKKIPSTTPWMAGSPQAPGQSSFAGIFHTQQHPYGEEIDEDGHTEFDYAPSGEESIDPVSVQSSSSSGQTSPEATDTRRAAFLLGHRQCMPEPQNIQEFQDILSGPQQQQQQQYQLNYWQRYQLQSHLTTPTHITPAAVTNTGGDFDSPSTMNPLHSASADPWLAAWPDSAGAALYNGVQR